MERACGKMARQVCFQVSGNGNGFVFSFLISIRFVEIVFAHKGKQGSVIVRADFCPMVAVGEAKTRRTAGVMVEYMGAGWCD